MEVESWFIKLLALFKIAKNKVNVYIDMRAKSF